MDKKTTGELLNVLKTAKPAEAAAILADNAASMVDGENPFTAYMRATLKTHGVPQQRLFLDAAIPERYGYKLISGEKRTKQRDYILRLCCAAGFSFRETQRALALYGMPALYARVPRDAVIIIALNTGCRSIEKMNELLLRHELPPLRACGETDVL